MSFPKRTDSNQTSLVKLFRSFDLGVAILSDVGKGFPDLLLSKKGFSVLVEVKDGAKPPSHRRLTLDEKLFHDKWPGPLVIISTVEEALALVDRLLLTTSNWAQ